MKDAKLQALAKRLSYSFNDVRLLQLAMSHRSVDGPHNERLEFLGDAILSFIVAEQLYQKFPRAEEGQLSRWRAHLVKGETLSVIAQELEIGNCLRLGPGEMKAGGIRRASILADALEALIGAVYLDGGMESCRHMVLSWYQSRLNDLSPSEALRDSKSRLQEYLQSRGFNLPIYEIIRTEGAEHSQTFYVRAIIKDLAMQSEGVGNSRKQAEQEAAKVLLQDIEINKGKKP